MNAEPKSKSVVIIGTRGYPSYYGGFETAVRKLAPFLAEQGWDVTVYGRRSATREDDPSIDPRVNRVVTRGTDSMKSSTLTYGFWSAIDAIRRKPDVALVMNVANGFWLPLLRMRGIRTVVNVDGIEWHRAKWGTVAKLVFKLGARLTAMFADQIVVDSEAIGEHWIRHFKRSGSYIPYGGEFHGGLPLEEGLAHRTFVLLVARFVPENSVQEFFDAVESIAAEFDVVIVGSSGYGGEFDLRASQLAADYPRVSWLGHLSDDTRLLSLWQHAGVYFHGHSVGGTNPALVQAMACGAPIVARDTVFNREVLGDAGVFVTPDSEAISEAILGLLSDAPRQAAMSEAAIERAHASFTWSGVVRSYEMELVKLLPSGSK